MYIPNFKYILYRVIFCIIMSIFFFLNKVIIYKVLLSIINELKNYFYIVIFIIGLFLNFNNVIFY